MRVRRPSRAAPLSPSSSMTARRSLCHDVIGAASAAEGGVTEAAVVDGGEEAAGAAEEGFTRASSPALATGRATPVMGEAEEEKKRSGVSQWQTVMQGRRRRRAGLARSRLALSTRS